MGLTVSERQDLERDGYVVLRDVVDDAVLAPVRDVCVRAVDDLAAQWQADGLLDDVFADEPFETRWASVRGAVPAKLPSAWRQILASPEVYDLWRAPALLDRIRDLVGEEVYAHGVWNGRPREPRSSVQKIGWHQDAHYYRDWMPTDPVLYSVWLPLVPVRTEHGALQFVPGTHEPRRALPTHKSENNLIEIVPDALPDREPVTIECDPGDAIFFTDTTVHQALPNESDTVRWSIDIRFGPATEDIIAKGYRGYICHSTDADRVESVETWLSRYAVGAEYEEYAEEAAEKFGIHPSDLKTF